MDLGLTADEIKELSWVQCENETCLKWRRISRDEVQKLGEEPWFCRMNTDAAHSKCEDPEEDHRKTIYTANKCGYRYIFSQLPQGSLVWAKMTGHVRWPAILSPDPSDGRYATINETGTPSGYHVEFLGPHHSHYWVHSGDVDVYGSSTSCPPRPNTKSKRGKKSISTHIHKKSECYTRKLQASIQEAEPLKPLTCEERLTKCVFTYRPQPENVLHLKEIDAAMEQKAVIQTPPDKNAENTRKKRGRPANSQLEDRKCSQAHSTKKSKKTVSFSKQPDVLHLTHHKDLSLSSSDDDDDSPAQQVPMVIRTKEERLQADIQLLKRAEEKFERRLRKFSERHGLPVKNNSPHWQGRQVSRYQVYMAVQERGGYNVVSANRAWAKVYHEACGTSPSGPHQSVSSAVKSFYTRNLLPYELYELRFSGNCASKPASSGMTQEEKHRKHNRLQLENKRAPRTPPNTASVGDGYSQYINQPIKVHGPNFQPMGGLGNTCQPAIAATPISFEPMDDMGNFRLPIRGQNRVECHPLGGQGNSERAVIGSGARHVATAHKDLETDDADPVDIDLLQEESTQALQELQAMANLLSTKMELHVPLEDETDTPSHKDCFTRELDRPTHIEAKPYASPLSSRRPVLLEFYSMQYGDEAEYTVKGQSAMMRVDDDTHQVPNITHPTAATPGDDDISSGNLPQRPRDEGAVCPDVYSNILLDMDAMGDEIDRLNEELHQDLMDV